MKNKGLIITLIVILSIIGVLLVSLLVLLLTRFRGFSFNMKQKQYELVKKAEYEVNNINEINTDLVSSLIELKLSTDDKIRVEYYGEKKEDINYLYNDNKLTISETRRNRFCFGFCYHNTKTIIYLPKSYDKSLILNTISGDIEFIDSFDDVQTNIKTTSGDIKVINSKDLKIITTSGDVSISQTNNINVKTVSGDVKINDVNNYLKIETVSGDVSVDSVNIVKESSINTISGDVEINKTNSIYIDTKTTSGDIDILNNDRKSDYVLKIKTTSGDIEVN